MQDEYAAIQRCVYACVCVCECVRVYVFVYHFPQAFLGNVVSIESESNICIYERLRILLYGVRLYENVDALFSSLQRQSRAILF